MLNKKSLKKSLFIFFLLFFFTEQSFSKTEYYKCPEKINTVLSGENQQISVGSIIGVNYVKLSGLSSPFTKITIKFKELGSQELSKIVINNKQIEENSLGYQIYDKSNHNDTSIENTFNFIKVKETYAFSRKKLYWYSGEQNQSKNSYQYESAGRCLKIELQEFEKETVLKTVKIKTKSKEDGVKNTSNPAKAIKGERPIAISWDGYDDLIIGKVKFSERDLVGVMNFSLSNTEECIGTYVLSTTKGTWSIYCDHRDVNASGILQWDNKTGLVIGNGEDSNGNKIKFKVAQLE